MKLPKNIELPIERREQIIGKIMSNIKVNQETGCWEWQGANSGTGRGGGYGRVCISGCTSATHKVVYTHFYGYVPNGEQIDHLCMNRLCCNPVHLELVTPKQNIKRMRKANTKRK